MKQKFKVGDTVKCIHKKQLTADIPSDPKGVFVRELRLGKKYIVSEYDENYDEQTREHAVGLEELKYLYSVKNFEKVKK